MVKGSATEALLERLLTVAQQRGWLQGGEHNVVTQPMSQQPCDGCIAAGRASLG